MNVSAADVNKLRQMTGVGIMDCKKALIEANGDFEAAIDILRKKGQKVSASRAGRDAGEGVVVVLTTPDSKTGILVALNCETDFVAKNADFIAAAQSFAKLALEKLPADRDALLALPYEGRTVNDTITDMIGKIGEKIEISRYEKLDAESVVGYVHLNNKLGVLIGLNKAGEKAINAGKDVAMQTAAMNPIALDESSVSADTVEREKSIVMEQIKQDPKMAGKPDEMIEKIASGKLGSFFKESTLLNQAFVKDQGKSVKQMLDETEKGLTVTAFRRVEIGK